MLFGCVQAVILHGIGLHGGRRRGGNCRTDGVAGEDYLIGREETLHAFVSYANALDALCEHLVGYAGKSVLLLDQAGDFHAAGRPQEGSAGISAHANCHIGLELLNQTTCLAHAGKHLEGHLDVVPDVLQGKLPLHPHDGKAYYFETFGRDFFHLHLALRPNEEKLRIRVQLLQFMADGYGREDVPSRAAAADYGPYGFVLAHDMVVSCVQSS